VTTTPEHATVACCSTIYGSPLAELLVGESFHPGGLDSTRDLLRRSGIGPGKRLLDVGCGLGASSHVAASEFGLRVDGVDASAAMIARAMDRPGAARIRWATASLPHLPFEDDAFDAVLAECVLSTTDRDQALREIARILRPGGTLMLSDVMAAGVAIPAFAHHMIGAALCVTDAWRPGEMDVLLPGTGFQIIDRRDRSSSIAGLIGRMEARLGIARVAARDLGVDLGGLIGSAIASDAIPPAAVVRDIVATINAAVADGTLAYTAVIAVRGDPR
jgi:SAM-dependent methyltransferase